MAVLVYVCMPLNKKRKLLCIICVALFVLALLIAPGLFSITSLFMWRLIFVIPIIWLIIIVMKLLVILMRRFVK